MFVRYNFKGIFLKHCWKVGVEINQIIFLFSTGTFCDVYDIFILFRLRHFVTLDQTMNMGKHDFLEWLLSTSNLLSYYSLFVSRQHRNKYFSFLRFTICKRIQIQLWFIILLFLIRILKGFSWWPSFRCFRTDWQNL